jgi:tRNA threonylcarbamoyladenosine biosynthesis protein TsaE
MRLGSLLRTGDVTCLTGDLGAGKTTFVQGLAAGWGSLDQVSSPTFIIVNLYRRLDQGQLFHLDAYRLSGPLEAVDLDLETMLDEGTLVIEWANIIKEALPEACLWVHLQYVDEFQRDLVFSARGQHYQNMLTNFREKVYGVS